jgi:hypothetical protein
MLLQTAAGAFLRDTVNRAAPPLDCLRHIVI